jgi:predicted ArsR family transcriptional regulator
VDTAGRVAALRAAHPDMATADMAERLGVSDRTVRRHLARHLIAPRTDMHIAAEVSA